MFQLLIRAVQRKNAGLILGRSVGKIAGPYRGIQIDQPAARRLSIFDRGSYIGGRELQP